MKPNPYEALGKDSTTTVGFQRFVNETPVYVPRFRYLAWVHTVPWGMFLLFAVVAAIGLGGIAALLEIFARAAENPYMPPQ